MPNMKGICNKNISYLICIYILLSFNTIANSKTIYVSPTGNDENDGLTQSTPLENISTAISLAQPNSGDTIRLLPGIHEIESTLKLERGINILGSLTDSSEVVLRYTGATWLSIILDLEKSDGWEVLDGNQFMKGFTIDGNRKAIWGIRIFRRNNVKISRMAFYHLEKGGIGYYGTSEWGGGDAVIQGGEISHCYFENTAGIHSEFQPGWFLYSSAITITQWFGGSVHHNVIVESDGEESGHGIEAATLRMVHVHDNTITVSNEKNSWGGWFAMEMSDLGGVEVYRNNCNSGLSLVDKSDFMGEYIPGMKNLLVYDNTLISDIPGGHSVQAIECYVRHAEYYNNYFENFGKAFATWSGTFPDTLKEVSIHHNIAVGPGSDLTSWFMLLTISGTTENPDLQNAIIDGVNMYNNIVTDFKYFVADNGNVTKNLRIRNNVFSNIETLYYRTSPYPGSNNLFQNNLFNEVSEKTNRKGDVVFLNNLMDMDPGLKMSGATMEEIYSPISDSSAVVDAGIYFGQPYKGQRPDIGRYEFNGSSSRLIMPSVYPQAGTYNDSVVVYLNDYSTDADIYYTLDGTEPTRDSGIYYEHPVTIKSLGENKLKVKAWKDNLKPSFTNEAVFKINKFSKSPYIVAPVTYENNSPIIVTLAAPDSANIYYSTDGSTPEVTEEYKYMNPIYLSETTTLKAISQRPGGYSASEMIEHDFTINTKLSESGRIINDTDTGINYFGTDEWLYVNRPGFGDYLEDIHVSSGNSGFTYTFSGNGIMYISEKSLNKSWVEISIDDSIHTRINCNSLHTISQDTVFLLLNLPDGSHTFQVKNNNPSKVIGLDALVIFGEDVNSVHFAYPHDEAIILINPHPNNGNFDVVFDERLLNMDYKIYDITGRLHMAGVISNSLSIELPGKGLYFFVIQRHNQPVIKKILVQ